jgi:hypothetical protein
VGRWGSNPRPADYEKCGPALWTRYLHGCHGFAPPMAQIAPFARMARSTNRSTTAAPDPLILLLCVTSPVAPSLHPRERRCVMSPGPSSLDQGGNDVEGQDTILPVLPDPQARLPHRISRAYSVSSSGPRTLRACVDPRAGLMVRRLSRAGVPPRPARAACRTRSAPPVWTYSAFFTVITLCGSVHDDPGSNDGIDRWGRGCDRGGSAAAAAL